jgi:hypothetical protein
MSDDWNELFDRILPDAEGEDLTDEDVERSLLHGMSDEDIEAVRSDSPMDACTCGRIMLGHTDSGSRNWNPDCEEHGVNSAWYNSETQMVKRAAARERTIDLQRRAREARQAHEAAAQRLADELAPFFEPSVTEE